MYDSIDSGCTGLRPGDDRRPPVAAPDPAFDHPRRASRREPGSQTIQVDRPGAELHLPSRDLPDSGPNEVRRHRGSLRHLAGPRRGDPPRSPPSETARPRSGRPRAPPRRRRWASTPRRARLDAATRPPLGVQFAGVDLPDPRSTTSNCPSRHSFHSSIRRPPSQGPTDLRAASRNRAGNLWARREKCDKAKAQLYPTSGWKCAGSGSDAVGGLMSGSTAETRIEHLPGANRSTFSTLHFGYLSHTVRLHVAPRSPASAPRIQARARRDRPGAASRSVIA